MAGNCQGDSGGSSSVQKCGVARRSRFFADRFGAQGWNCSSHRGTRLREWQRVIPDFAQLPGQAQKIWKLKIGPPNGPSARKISSNSAWSRALRRKRCRWYAPEGVCEGEGLHAARKHRACIFGGLPSFVLDASWTVLPILDLYGVGACNQPSATSSGPGWVWLCCHEG